MTDRIERINELLRQELSQLIETDAEALGMISVIAIATARDLSSATVLIAPVNQSSSSNLIDQLAKRASAYRHQLGQRLQLKKIPEFHFQLDTKEADYIRVEKLLDQVSNERTS